ncbi:MAG: NepR family anti-sigma factor [Methyloceanibacter sp.]|jgi:hypothetical protein
MATKTMDLSAEARGAHPGESALHEREMEDGFSANLQAHIGRHVRAVFDEVAREPVPERLLRLLKDLEQSGDK